MNNLIGMISEWAHANPKIIGIILFVVLAFLKAALKTDKDDDEDD